MSEDIQKRPYAVRVEVTIWATDAEASRKEAEAAFPPECHALATRARPEKVEPKAKTERERLYDERTAMLYRQDAKP